VTPDFTNLFAMADLHASRWQLRQSNLWGRMLSDWMPRFYDRQGFPIPGEDGDPSSACLTWGHMFEAEHNRVAWDELPDGSHLSTVWLGMDHALGLGPPLIFETMRFGGETHDVQLGDSVVPNVHESCDFPDPETGELIDQLRYTTEEEALAAHHAIVRRLRLREGH
jgi:hypothetical protein